MIGSSQQQVAVVRPCRTDLLAHELTANKLIRTVKDLHIYSVTANDAPRVMEELGRIREAEFRKEGGGTGNPADVDNFDLGDTPYRQLIVWDARRQEIVAAYRYILCRDAVRCGGVPALATEVLFEFSPKFRADYLPYTIELGRSVVNRGAKRRFLGLFAAWAGLGALVREHPDIRYFFGKVTMYPTYDVAARDALLCFLRLYFPDPDRLLRPRRQFEVVAADRSALFSGADYETDYAALNAALKESGELIPPLLISYLGLTSTMRTFGTARNPQFGNAEETAILIPIRDINPDARARFIDSYRRVCPGYFCTAKEMTNDRSR